MRRITPKLAVLILAVLFLLVGPRDLYAQGIDWDSPAFRQEMQSFQQFLANHPWIAGKLREKPSLANDAGFLRLGPELPQFLTAHPLIQSDFKIDPNGVMARAQRGGGASTSDSVNYQEMQKFKLFLSMHPWVAGKLQQNPALANDKRFVKGDKELEEFLNAHPYVQAQFRADPNDFMQRITALATVEPRPGADDPSASDYAELRVFLQIHKFIADRLNEDPTRATNKDFLNKNKDLRVFLEAHPYLQQQFKQDARRTLDQTLQPAGGYL